MGKSLPLEELLRELAIYEASVSTWNIPEELPRAATVGAA